LKRALVASLYGSPSSLAAGALAGSVAGLTVAALTPDPLVSAIALAIPLVAFVRVCHALAVRHTRGLADGTELSEAAYEVGAWLFSLLLGSLAFLTLTRSEHPGLHLLVSCLSIGYAAGICARNAARPAIARGQLALSVLPLSAALFASADPVKWILAAVNLLFVAALAQITKQTHSVFVSALTNADQGAEDARRAVSNLPVMSWTADATGAITYQSAHWSEFTGTSEVGSGNSRIGLVHPADWPGLDDAWREAVKSGRDFKFRYRLLHRTGRYRWVVSSGRAERNIDGRVVQWHGACLDVEDVGA
jgi:PAS domain S-box-containing protein